MKRLSINAPLSALHHSYIWTHNRSSMPHTLRSMAEARPRFSSPLQYSSRPGEVAMNHLRFHLRMRPIHSSKCPSGGPSQVRLARPALSRHLLTSASLQRTGMTVHSYGLQESERRLIDCKYDIMPKEYLRPTKQGAAACNAQYKARTGRGSAYTWLQEFLKLMCSFLSSLHACMV